MLAREARTQNQASSTCRRKTGSSHLVVRAHDGFGTIVVRTNDGDLGTRSAER